jgi:hypothetical protein
MNSALKDSHLLTANGGPGWYKQASAKEQKLFREWVVGVLKTNTVDLTFEKKDGTIREMKATLEESKLPVIEKKTDRVRKENDEVLSMFDLEKNEWRSCRFDSITNVNFTLGE